MLSWFSSQFYGLGFLHRLRYISGSKVGSGSAWQAQPCWFRGWVYKGLPDIDTGYTLPRSSQPCPCQTRAVSHRIHWLLGLRMSFYYPIIVLQVVCIEGKKLSVCFDCTAAESVARTWSICRQSRRKQNTTAFCLAPVNSFCMALFPLFLAQNSAVGMARKARW